jgi:hypothetical protein
VKALSKFPLLTNFVSFHYEMGRNFFNILGTINKELRSDNPEVVKMGQRRAAGMLLSGAVMPTIVMGLKQFWGVTDDEEEKLRPFLADWNENSQIMYLSEMKDGRGRAFDASFMDPMAVYTKPLMASIREPDSTQQIEAARAEFMDQIMSESQVFGRLMSLIRNKDSAGREVYREHLPWSTKAKDMAAYMAEPFVPGSIKRYQKMMESEHPVTEAIAMLGFRSVDIDIPKSFYYRSGDFKRRIDQTEANIRDVLYKEKDAKRRDELIAELETARQGYYKEWSDMMQNAILAGASTTEVYSSLKKAEPRDIRQRMVSLGVYEPYQPGPVTVGRLAEKGRSVPPRVPPAPALAQ